MDKKLEELHRRMQELHEKNRQEAMRRFEGKELQDVLKKLDELHQPLERIYTNAKTRLSVTRKQILGIVLGASLVVVLLVITNMCLSSVLFFHDRIHWAALHVLYPIGVAGAVCFNLTLLPRLCLSNGMTYPFRGSKLRYPAYVLFSFLQGAALPCLVLYVPLSIGMYAMNTDPVRIDSTIVEIKQQQNRYYDSSSLYNCRVTASREVIQAGSKPGTESLTLAGDDIELPLKPGDEILLMGRESFAGIVIDKIRKNR